ncbi:unnamed protein product, partial [Closterium sp. NIES-64]
WGRGGGEWRGGRGRGRGSAKGGGGRGRKRARQENRVEGEGGGEREEGEEGKENGREATTRRRRARRRRKSGEESRGGKERKEKVRGEQKKQQQHAAAGLKLLYVTPEKVARSKRFMSKLEKCHAAGRLSLIAIDLLYVTPEKVARSKRFMSKLEKCHAVGRLSLIAIDEAHCCSQWGHDFRPDYAHLSVLKKQFPKRPCSPSHSEKAVPKTPMLALIVVLPHMLFSCGAALTVSAVLIVVLPTVSAALIVVLPHSECCSHSGAALTVSAVLIVVLPSQHYYDYAHLSVLKKQFPKTPMLALTATATERVRDDVRDMLQMRRCELFVSSVNRPNLFYEVREKPPGAAPAVESIARFILEHYAPSDSGIVYCFSRKECEQVQCGIVYCFSRKECEQVRCGGSRYAVVIAGYILSPPSHHWSCCATLVLTSPSHHSQVASEVHSLSPPLASLVWSVAPPLSSPPPSHHSQVASELSLRGIPAAHYHADMDPSHRTHVHVSWSRGEVQVIVGTVSDRVGRVRFVIHHTLSKSIETYYQESGRAGRDGLPARCILFFRCADLPRQSSMVFAENAGLINLYAMGRYAMVKNAGLINLYAMGRYAMGRYAMVSGWGGGVIYSSRGYQTGLMNLYAMALFSHPSHPFPQPFHPLSTPIHPSLLPKESPQGGGGGERTAQQDFTPHARSILEFVQETQSSKEKSLTLLQLTEQWRTGGRGGGGGGGGVGRGNVKAGGKGESESWGSLVKGITKETTEQL